MISSFDIHHPLSQERIFWPRTSEVVAELAEVLAQPPESPLSVVEKQEVLAFERDLFAGKYGEVRSPNALKDIVSSEENSIELVPEYIATEQGAAELKESLGITIDPTEGLESVKNQLRAIPFDTLNDADNDKKLRMLQGRSLEYLKTLYSSMAQDETPARDIDRITLVKNPHLLLDRLDILQTGRVFVRSIRNDLKQQPAETITAAKRMVTDIYRDKLNSQVAAAYPSLIELQSQLRVQGDIIPPAVAEKLRGMIRVAEAIESSTDLKTQFVRLLDYVRNGAAVDENGKLTPIDQSLYGDVASLNQMHVSTGESYFTKDEIQQLKEMVFDSLEMKAFIDAYLDRSGLVEQGWETEVRTDTVSFAVSAIHKKIKIPQKFNATVAREYPATGVVGLLEHEVGGNQPGHVMQSVNASLNPDIFAIARSEKFRGKRFLAMREAGGTAAEAHAMQHYFGQTRRFSTSYASAMEVLVAGGTQPEAAKAFVKAQLDGTSVSEAEMKKAYDIAADRVLRLVRFGGFNSQPIQYVEAATVRKIAAGISEEMTDVMFAEAVYDPVDMIRLHRFGLLASDATHRFQARENPQAIVTDLLRQRLNATP